MDVELVEIERESLAQFDRRNAEVPLQVVTDLTVLTARFAVQVLLEALAHLRCQFDFAASVELFQQRLSLPFR